MIGFKLSLNGKFLFTAGHQEAMDLSAGVVRVFGSDDTFLSASATYAIEDKNGTPIKAKEVHWIAPNLKIGDEVTISILEIDKASAATFLHDQGVKSVPFYGVRDGECSFCGSSENETNTLFERANGKICASCVQFYNRLLEYSESDNA